MQHILLFSGSVMLLCYEDRRQKAFFSVPV